MSLLGKKQLDVTEAGAGHDIVVASKMNVNTNDTICDASRVLNSLLSSSPSLAIKCCKGYQAGHESKISAAIRADCWKKT
ncbi:hypothetical protein [Ruminococcus albus]|uniref:hypothetical protein n=1 Tax=Ruminococcus albus TaxID=1264 RepID=UPI001D14C32A|nr:hypothetical protein [Ruminococcus albus]MCC3351686.1 hypothetical protein [Ruminococcus albus 8]